MRAAPPTNRPILGRRENLRFPATFLRKSGNRDFGISSGCHMGGAYWIPAARSLASPPRVSEGVSGENGGRKLYQLRRPAGPAFESCPAHRSPDFGPTRKSAISGDTVGEIRRSGFRDLVGTSWGGWLLDSGGAFSDVSDACFRGGFRRKLGPEIGRLRRPAGARIWESPRPQTARFRAGANICEFRGHCWGNPEIGISGSRQEFTGGVY